MMLRLGDYIVFGSMTLNLLAFSLYLYEGHWKMAMYWFAAFQLNLCAVMMR